VIRVLGPSIPILGVCLGHQCINEVFGGRTVRAPQPWHGKTSRIRHDARTLFAGIPQNFEGARYHSLVADRACVSSELEISAETEDGLVMGLRHKRHLIEGVQFHPESFLSSHGELMLRNFLKEVRYGCRN
jgi:anthranilate synthase/aminodeoxychorismate synthase-like glutamine amidotransferase